MKRTKWSSILLWILIVFGLIVGAMPQKVEAQAAVIDKTHIAVSLALRALDAAIKKIAEKNIEGRPVSREYYYAFLRDLENLISEGEALAYSEEGARAEFEEKYPGYKVDEALWEEKRIVWTDTVLDTLSGALEASGEHSKNFELQTKATGEMLRASNESLGNLSAIQAGNAISASVVTELVKLRQLMLTNLNTEIVTRASEVNERAQAEAISRAWGFQGGRDNYPRIETNDERAIRLSDISVRR